MSFSGGFADELEVFRTGTGDRLTRDNWGIVVQPSSPPDNAVLKRRQRMASILARKRARMTRSDENIVDEVAKKAAIELLNQIQNTPGTINLDFSCPQTAGICPIPTDFLEVVPSDWSTDRLQEGQMKTLLAHAQKEFSCLRLPRIKGGKVEREIPPRRMNQKEALEKVKNENRSKDNYAGFASGILHFLRTIDKDSAETLAESIATLIESETTKVKMPKIDCVPTEFI